MMDEKIKKLEKELSRYQKKLAQLTVDWSETKAGSRYGDEYGEIQIKVYRSMIDALKKKILELKKKK